LVDGEVVNDDDEDSLSPPPSYTLNENSNLLDNMSSMDGPYLYDPNADDGSSYNPSSINFRQTPSSRNDLNYNIMRLEEQVNKLSKLTKGINTFINLSNQIEVEKLNNSNRKVAYSSIGLEDHLSEIDNIELQFKNKINSILDKIDTEYNKIKSALGGCTYTFLEGGCGSCVGGGNRDEYFYAFNHSSKKRFY